MTQSKKSERLSRSNIQMAGSISSAPIMTIAGLFIGYYAGESISPGLGTIGAFFGAMIFLLLGSIEVFNIMRKESKIAKEKKRARNLVKLANTTKNLYNEDKSDM